MSSCYAGSLCWFQVSGLKTDLVFIGGGCIQGFCLLPNEWVVHCCCIQASDEYFRVKAWYGWVKNADVLFMVMLMCCYWWHWKHLIPREKDRRGYCIACWGGQYSIQTESEGGWRCEDEGKCCGSWIEAFQALNWRVWGVRYVQEGRKVFKLRAEEAEDVRMRESIVEVG